MKKLVIFDCPEEEEVLLLEAPLEAAAAAALFVGLELF